MPLRLSARDAHALAVSQQRQDARAARDTAQRSANHPSPGFWWFHIDTWPPGPNDRLHWAQKAKRNRLCADQLLWQLKTCTPRLPLERIEVLIIFTRKGGPPMDTDNAIARCKCLQDALVTGGLVVDDSPAHVTLSVKQEFAPGIRAVRVEVWEVTHA